MSNRIFVTPTSNIYANGRSGYMFQYSKNPFPRYMPKCVYLFNNKYLVIVFNARCRVPPDSTSANQLISLDRDLFWKCYSTSLYIHNAPPCSFEASEIIVSERWESTTPHQQRTVCLLWQVGKFVCRPLSIWHLCPFDSSLITCIKFMPSIDCKLVASIYTTQLHIFSFYLNPINYGELKWM